MNTSIPSMEEEFWDYTPKIKKSIISQNIEEYKNNVELTLRASKDMDGFFGRTILTWLHAIKLIKDKNSEYFLIAKSEIGRDEDITKMNHDAIWGKAQVIQQGRLDSYLKTSKEELLQSKRATFRLISKALSSMPDDFSEILKGFRATNFIFGQENNAQKDTTYIVRRLKENKIPDELYIKILQNHKNEYEKAKVLFEELLKETLPQILTNVENFIENYMDSRDMVMAKEKMHNLHYTVCDSVTSITEQLWGYYEVNWKIVSIAHDAIVNAHAKNSAEDAKKIFSHILTHEILHAVSGNTVVMEKEEDNDGEQSDEFSFSDFKELRVGLHFHEKESQFRWLNEAVTETITRDICEIPESQCTYKKERELFNLLCKQGKNPISPDIFYRAYFENYNPERKEDYGTGVPSWKTMQDILTKSYAPGFLMKLERYIESNDLEKTIEAMSSDEGISQIKKQKESN